jgi:RNA polymerase sigma-70 factor, ECF subfamily
MLSPSNARLRATMDTSPDRTKVFLTHFLSVQSRVYAYVRSQIARKSDAEDVLQETAVTLWEKFDSFQPDTDFLAWAYQVARFKVQHHYQKQTRRHRLFTEAFGDLVAQRMVGMKDELADMEALLAQCMTHLGDADRDVVRRCYSVGATVAGVARQLGRPLGTIKNVLKRSRRNLYDCILRSLRREEQP